MNTREICIISSLIIFGLIATGSGIRTWLGKDNRAWYLVPNYYVLLPKGIHYAMPIGGLMFIVLGISLLMPEPELVRRVWAIGVCPLGIIAFLTIVFHPKWLKPKWVRWLEENHGDILEVLIKEGRETPNWAERVTTQEGLEKWVEEVRQNYEK